MARMIRGIGWNTHGNIILRVEFSSNERTKWMGLSEVDLTSGAEHIRDYIKKDGRPWLYCVHNNLVPHNFPCSMKILEDRSDGIACDSKCSRGISNCDPNMVDTESVSMDADEQDSDSESDSNTDTDEFYEILDNLEGDSDSEEEGREYVRGYSPEVSASDEDSEVQNFEHRTPESQIRPASIEILENMRPETSVSQQPAVQVHVEQPESSASVSNIQLPPVIDLTLAPHFLQAQRIPPKLQLQQEFEKYIQYVNLVNAPHVGARVPTTSFVNSDGTIRKMCTAKDCPFTYLSANSLRDHRRAKHKVVRDLQKKP